MCVKDQALLSAAVALTLISEKARFQAARTTDDEAKRSLLETNGHCTTALRIIQEARQNARMGIDSGTTAKQE